MKLDIFAGGSIIGAMVNSQLHDVLRALPRQYFALLFLIATGCGMRTPLNRSANVGGAPSKGGTTGQGLGGNAAGTNGSGGSVAVAGSGGLRGSGGRSDSGGLTGSGGVVRTGGLGGVAGGMVSAGGMPASGGTSATGGRSDSGGLTGSGGVVRTGGLGGVAGTRGAGGMVSTGGTLASGGTSATTGATGSGPVFGVPCVTNDDCPSGSDCCGGSVQRCDGTRVPSGDGTNPGEFAVSSDGLTVTDTITGLVWQRSGLGTWSGCLAGDGRCSWEQATAYCGSLTLGGVAGWRLPAREELLTIVDFTRANPSIDPNAFPDTPADWFWTSSPYAGSSGLVWYVYFGSGNSSYSGAGGYRVRCVR